MTHWPEINWQSFGEEADCLLKLAEAEGLTSRTISERRSIGVSALSRARNGRPLSAANYLAICALLDLDPYGYLTAAIPANVPQFACAETV